MYFNKSKEAFEIDRFLRVVSHIKDSQFPLCPHIL